MRGFSSVIPSNNVFKRDASKKGRIREDKSSWDRKNAERSSLPEAFTSLME